MATCISRRPSGFLALTDQEHGEPAAVPGNKQSLSRSPGFSLKMICGNRLLYTEDAARFFPTNPSLALVVDHARLLLGDGLHLVGQLLQRLGRLILLRPVFRRGLDQIPIVFKSQADGMVDSAGIAIVAELVPVAAPA